MSDSDRPVQPQWQWWDHLRRTGDFLSPLQDGAIHYGYYRRSSSRKDQSARWVPIGIWGKGDSLTCEVDGKKVDPTRPGRRPFDLLFHKSLQAVDHATYMAVTRKGSPWPDAPPPLEGPDPTPQPPTEEWTMRGVRAGGERDPQPPTDYIPDIPDSAFVATKYITRIGDDGARTVSVPDDRKNWRIDENPGTDFPVQVPAAEIQKQTHRIVPASDREVSREDNIPSDQPDDRHILVDQQAKLAQEEDLVRQRLLLPIQSQDEANAASEHANRIAALGKWFADEYERKNRPVLEFQKRLRIDYLHPSQEAAGHAKALTQHMATFLLAEQRKLEEEQRRASEAEALRIQKAAEEAAAKGETITPEIVRPGAPTPPRRAGAGGLTGRRTTVSEENVGTVTDYTEFAGFLIRGSMANPPPTYCSNMELKTVLDELARKLARTLPRDQKISGLNITTQAKARR